MQLQKSFAGHNTRPMKHFVPFNFRIEQMLMSSAISIQGLLIFVNTLGMK